MYKTNVVLAGENTSCFMAFLEKEEMILPGQVYIARTLEEAREILNKAEGNKLKSLFCRIYIRAWVLAKNCILNILWFCMFKKWSYSKKDFHSIVVYTQDFLVNI